MAEKAFVEAQSLVTQTLELGIALAVQLGMEELLLEIPLPGDANIVLSRKKDAFSSVRCSSISNFHQGRGNKSSAKKRTLP